MTLFWIVALVVLAGMAYVRLAPSDPDRWHRQASVTGMEPRRKQTGYVWRKEVQGDGMAELSALDRVIMNTPRTTRLTGSVAAGQVTYITRTKVMGFPDYTTIGVYDGQIDGTADRYIEINARLRFGRSDLGVNANRVKGWLSQL
ncbi:DUF1499 domain-containing protein [Sulfitobacter sp. JB4-11]|uniref:DUF1499 domain-containing protein n=1 Tax=Sulfitobacter rhodophyticola TaxID=3238304 RepID=UPI0035119832